MYELHNNSTTFGRRLRVGNALSTHYLECEYTAISANTKNYFIRKYTQMVVPAHPCAHDISVIHARQRK